MTKRRSTKRALLSSVVALLLCFSMLLGSTFAWFTDSVSSARNTIQSGNLDVALEYKTDWDDNWAPVEETTKLFKEGALYEPGYTEVVYLRVVNKGNLALKYNLDVKILGETTSTNVDEETFALSEYLEIGTYVQDEYSSGFNYADILMPAMFGTRENALEKVTLTKLAEATGVICSDNPLLPGEQTAQVAAIVLTMPTTVGNEANHMTGVDAPTIDLGINLVATQHMHEKDSFDEKYDKDAEYLVTDTWDGSTVDTSWYNEENTAFVISTVEELLGLEALVNDKKISFDGKTVELVADLDMTGVKWEPIGHYLNATPMFKGTFDGKNHTISNLYTSTKYGANKNEGSALFGTVSDGCIIKNLKLTDVTSFSSYGYAAALIGSVYGGDVTIENVHVQSAEIASGRHVGGFIGISGRTGHNMDCTITFTNCSMKDIEMGYVHANGGTSNAIGDEGAQFTNVLTLNGIDSIVEENISVTGDRSFYDAMNAAH